MNGVRELAMVDVELFVADGVPRDAFSLVPPGSTRRWPTFLLSDGKVASKPQIVSSVLTLEALCQRYVEVHSNGAMERNSLDTVEMHLRHFRRTLGDDDHRTLQRHEHTRR